MARTIGAKKGIHGNSINKNQFENLCQLMCTQEEICGFFGVHTNTLDSFIKQNYGNEYTFISIYPMLSASGKISLRRNQFELSKTNSSMAIFLGKQYLGQREYIESDITENIIVNTTVENNDDNQCE